MTVVRRSVLVLTYILAAPQAAAESLSGCWLVDLERSVEHNSKTRPGSWTEGREARFRKGYPQDPGKRWVWCFDDDVLTRHLGNAIDTRMPYQVIREVPGAVTLEIDSGVKSSTSFHFVDGNTIYVDDEQVRTYLVRRP